MTTASTPPRILAPCGPITLGCDPEFFFQRDGKIIGSEKVLNIDPINPYSSMKAFVIDGVQVELNPAPSTCRQTLSGNILAAFTALKENLALKGDIKACFSAVVDVNKDELDSLSDKAKVFGCAPSYNADGGTHAISVDPRTYLKRSAGGHIHLGLDFTLRPHAVRIVPILDCLVGLPFVMIDRDPEAAERRKVYGRAGEYRLPLHGLEYRTLSNVWLRSYQLMSLAMATARQACQVIYATTKIAPYGWDAEGDLMKRVDLEKVREAINTNDLSLAREQFEGVAAFIHDHVPNTTSGLSRTNLPNFFEFVRRIEADGLNSLFPDDPLDHWTKTSSLRLGWESYITTIKPKAEAKVEVPSPDRAAAVASAAIEASL